MRTVGVCQVNRKTKRPLHFRRECYRIVSYRFFRCIKVSFFRYFKVSYSSIYRNVDFFDISKCRFFDSHLSKTMKIVSILCIVCRYISYTSNSILVRYPPLPCWYCRLPDDDQNTAHHTTTCPIKTGGGGAYSFVACPGRLTIDHASLSRRSTVPAPNGDTSNVWGAHYLFFPYTAVLRTR